MGGPTRGQARSMLEKEGLGWNPWAGQAGARASLFPSSSQKPPERLGLGGGGGCIGSTLECVWLTLKGAQVGLPWGLSW